MTNDKMKKHYLHAKYISIFPYLDCVLPYMEIYGSVSVSFTLCALFFAGLDDLLLEGVFQWSDGTDYNGNILNWGKGEPNNYNGGEDCVTIRGGVLNDNVCHHQHGFICKRKRGI